MSRRFLRSFLTASKPSGRSITAAKRKEKEKKGRRKKKKIPKIKKLKDVGHFLIQKLSQNFDFCACPSHHVVKCDPGGQQGKLLCGKCIFNRIKLIWPRSSFKSTKMSKKRIFCKKFLESMGYRKHRRISRTCR